MRIWQVLPGDDGEEGLGVRTFEGSEDGEGETREVIGREGDGDGDGDRDVEGRWSARVVADFDDHKCVFSTFLYFFYVLSTTISYNYCISTRRSQVTSVEWNITGTVLSSAGNDGRVRLWKATVGGVWRAAGSIGVEATEGEGKGDGNEDAAQGDTEMG